MSLPTYPIFFLVMIPEHIYFFVLALLVEGYHL